MLAVPPGGAGQHGGAVMRFKRVDLVAVAVIAAGLAVAACGPMPRDHTYGTKTAVATPVAAPESQFTRGQQQAIDKAQSYLDHSAFSKKGLIHQLEYEQFSAADAAFAVEQLAVDWNEQAVKKGKSYLDHSSFSQQGLVHQLEYEGFTPAEAQYGASVAYSG